MGEKIPKTRGRRRSGVSTGWGGSRRGSEQTRSERKRRRNLSLGRTREKKVETARPGRSTVGEHVSRDRALEKSSDQRGRSMRLFWVSSETGGSVVGLNYHFSAGNRRLGLKFVVRPEGQSTSEK